ncbi:hypothetical protein EYF80_019730 [Liparis tanakae]|uniref:Uncharacterized protein n=1 Tax=Liparis tanakae TaxID=230148 RepID=A0A4Z2HYG6_9TELE|nr:hypothetical protein EYF80_019730 [Liparis tanakae]
MMVKDDLMAKGKETEWRGWVSTYRRSEIDPGVLKLSKPDSGGTILQVCSPTWTNKDIRDIDAVRTSGPVPPPSFCPPPSACREAQPPLANVEKLPADPMEDDKLDGHLGNRKRVDPFLCAAATLVPVIQRAVLEVALGFIRADGEGGRDHGQSVTVQQRPPLPGRLTCDIDREDEGLWNFVPNVHQAGRVEDDVDPPGGLQQAAVVGDVTLDDHHLRPLWGWNRKTLRQHLSLTLNEIELGKRLQLRGAALKDVVLPVLSSFKLTSTYLSNTRTSASPSSFSSKSLRMWRPRKPQPPCTSGALHAYVAASKGCCRHIRTQESLDSSRGNVSIHFCVRLRHWSQSYRGRYWKWRWALSEPTVKEVETTAKV